MRFLSIVVFIITSCAANLVAQDSLLLLSKIRQNTFDVGKFSTMDLNPVRGLYQQQYPLLQVGIEGLFRSESPVLLQQRGSGKKLASFEAAAYQPISDSLKVWGNVLYNNGVVENVVWNETSDMELLYPYLSADSLGGDFNTETYYFNGGYAQQFSRIILGAQLKYRALQEYRDIDPRPKNTVADIEIRAGAGYRLSPQYNISLSGMLRRYKQTNLIKYYSPLGGNRTYHLTGLGMDYVRFSGTNNSIYYKGNGAGATLDIVATKPNGINATLAYNRFWFEKILSDLNNLSMVNLLNQQFIANVAYISGIAKVVGARLNVEYNKKNGIENIFGTSAGNVWSKIAEAEMFRQKNFTAQLSGILEQNLANKSWSIVPSLAIHSLSLNYLSPKRKISAEHLEAQIETAYSQNVGKVLLTANACVKYMHCIGTNTELTDMQTSHIMYNLTHRTADLLQSSCASYKLKLRADFSTNRRIAYFVQVQANVSEYFDIDCTSNQFSTSIGIVL